MRPENEIEACREGHRRLLTDLEPMSDEDFRAPSLLPGWSRAHLVSHLVNKAQAHVVVVGGPASGEVRRLHPVGHDADQAAATGADRSGAELCADLARSFDELEAAWDTLSEADWKQHGIMQAGPRTMAEIVSHHLRNVEVHHVDLDIGYRPADWPPTFVEGELAKRLRSLPDRADHADLLLWLLDRGPAPGLQPW